MEYSPAELPHHTRNLIGALQHQVSILGITFDSQAVIAQLSDLSSSEGNDDLFGVIAVLIQNHST